MNALAAQTDDECYDAVRRRDRAYDGRLVYGVRTTGIYCRPSCAARPARRENLSFYPSVAQARAAGLRPCKRCRPDQFGQPDPQAQAAAQAIARACRLIERSETAPSLDALAAIAGMSRFHFHRVFRRIVGVTPRQFAEAERVRRFAQSVAAGDSVTRAIFEAGYNASSRFYATAGARLGMTPSQVRRGGSGTEIAFALGQCSLGAVLVARTAKGICAILLGEDPEPLLRDLQDRFPRAELRGDDADFAQSMAMVIGLIEAPGAAGAELPLDIRGTAFQQRVWQALRAIPAGSIASYAQIAASIGHPMAIRAVAGACASNPLAVAIPCHRVVRTDGALSGYRWGIERKRALLERERKAG